MANSSLSANLTTIDYGVFLLSIVLSALTGFFYAYKDRKNNGIENFHRGNKNINPIATSLSITVTLISASAIVGNTAEVYSFGTMIAWRIVAQVIGTAIAAHIFLPIFYKMDRISIFEFIEMRFGKVSRTVCALLSLLNLSINMGLSLYAPALATEAMTGISLFTIMAVASVVCISYTVLGGMKAVVWADTLQFAIMVAGIICLVIEGCRYVGGLDKAWSIANRFGRIEFNNFDFDPRTRHTVWNLAIGFVSTYSNIVATNQLTMQRACSLSTLKSAKLAIWFSMTGVFLVTVLNILNGVIMFAYYHTCDPVANSRIDRADQLFPLMIIDTLGGLPGLPGLLLACMFSASLSTISSAYSATSAIIMEDFVRPNSRKKLSDKTMLFISKVAVVVMGLIVFGMGCLVSSIQGLLSQLVFTVGSILGGALFSIFVVGVLFPWINTAGVVVGFVLSIGLTGWLVIGKLFNMSPPTPLSVSIEGCTTVSDIINTSSTTTTNPTYSSKLLSTSDIFTEIDGDMSGVSKFYELSYMWYNLFGAIIFIVVSLFVSFVTGVRDPETVDSKLMCPLFYNMCPFLPDNYRRKLLFGVRYEIIYSKEKHPFKIEDCKMSTIEKKLTFDTTRL